jgi:cysteine desulfurase
MLDCRDTMRIYLDHNATTPPAETVVDAMSRALREVAGNASSVHSFGQQAKSAIDEARTSVAGLLGGEASEVIFTGSGTEADNLALRGAAEALESTGRREIVVSAIEHEAVLNTARALARRGWTMTTLPVNASAVVSPDAVRDAVSDRTAIVSVMHANNEVGTVQPVAEIAAIAHERGALMHTDAVQSAGKIPLAVKALGIDLLSISAHKFYGPKGVGALWVRRGVRLTQQMTGGRQERNRRAGTENVPGIIGLGVAARLATEALGSSAARVAALRDRLEAGILRDVPHAALNGAREPRVPNTTNISFERVEAESLLIALDLEGIAVSTGSACSSGTLEPSHVLKAMGLGSSRAQSSLRFSLGSATTETDIDRVVAVLPGLVQKLRALTRSTVDA